MHPSFDWPSLTRQGVSAFNQPLSLNTASVTEMRHMFRSAKSFNQPLSFNTSSVTDMRYMFRGASIFDQPLSFDLSRVPPGATYDNSHKLFNMFAGPIGLSNCSKHQIYTAMEGFDAFQESEYFSEWVNDTCPPPSLPRYPSLHYRD